jgi:hypothetical protein
VYLEVIHQDGHEAELVSKANKQQHPIGMHRNRESFVRKELYELQSHVVPIPNAHSLVKRASGNQGLPNAGIYPSD